MPRLKQQWSLAKERLNFLSNDHRKEQTMQQQFARISLLATILAALALTSPARAGEEVPFKGRSSGVVKTTTCQAPNQACTILYGEGEATHLGHFTVIAHVVVDLVAGTITGPWTLTAANGDVLFVTFEGFGIDETHGGGFMTVEGGTGRFQGGDRGLHAGYYV